MKFLKFLHAVYQSLYAFLRHGIVARCTETAYGTVSLDTYHTLFGSEFQEVSFKKRQEDFTTDTMARP